MQPTNFPERLTERQLQRARELRTSLTDAERRLWYFLRAGRFTPDAKKTKWRRQHPIGPYYVDFYCHAAKLIIELDGSQHSEPQGLQYDAERSRYLEALGFRVLRFTDIEALTQTDGMLERIAEVLAGRFQEPIV